MDNDFLKNKKEREHLRGQAAIDKKNREIELFSIVDKLNYNLTNLNREKAKNSDVINVISSFQQVGSKSETLLKSKPILFFILGVLLVVFYLLLIQLNKFLDNYKK